MNTKKLSANSLIVNGRVIMLVACIIVGSVVTIQAELEGFIVGGELAQIKKYPHSAFLTVTCITVSQDIHMWICGSSLINQKIVVTAAHCLHYCTSSSKVAVNMGNEFRTKGVVRSVSGFVLHEKYNPLNSDRDIALAIMNKAVEFNDKISRVAIMKNPPYSEMAYLAGWGLIDEEQETPGMVLKVLDQKVWRHSSCAKLFGVLNRGTICASSMTRDNFAAKRDSGSGLVVRGFILLGLVSYKFPTLANNVIVYTDVGFYYDWINYHATRLHCM